MLVRVMARETARFNAELLDAVAPAPGEIVLEVGFGHGHTLDTAARRAPETRFAGIDVSADAYRVAEQYCRPLISRGQLELRIGDSASLPWSDASFDKVFCAHTIYFWREPLDDLGEILRVLKPTGELVLGFRERSEEATAAFPAEVYRFYSASEVLVLLQSAGFVETKIQRAASGEDLRLALARRAANDQR
jgi:ubiquinone/menaquinone biosynthesis C-methylase UbiE